MRLWRNAAAVLMTGAVASGCATVQRVMPGILSDANVIATFNTIDHGEIETAQLVRQKASSAAVRNYAERMEAEHTAMLRQRQELASRLNIQPESPRLAVAIRKTQQKVMEELRSKSGSDLDRAYLEYQTTRHEQAMWMAAETARSANNAQLRQHLIEARPSLQSHSAAARSVEYQVVALGRDLGF